MLVRLFYLRFLHAFEALGVEFLGVEVLAAFEIDDKWAAVVVKSVALFVGGGVSGLVGGGLEAGERLGLVVLNGIGFEDAILLLNIIGLSLKTQLLLHPLQSLQKCIPLSFIAQCLLLLLTQD